MLGLILCCLYEHSQSCHDEEEDEEEVKSFEVRIRLNAFVHLELDFLCSFEEREASQT